MGTKSGPIFKNTCCHAPITILHFQYTKTWNHFRSSNWGHILVPNLGIKFAVAYVFFCFVCWLVAAVLGSRHVHWLHALVECTGRGSTHLRGAALARILALEADMKTLSGVARARAQSRQVFDQMSVCSVARARGPRALAERLLRNDDRRATKQIELARRALTMLAATVCTKSIASHCRVERRTRR